jgi:hypothetical protein
MEEYMNKKRTVGIILLLIGVVVIIYATVQKERIAAAGGSAYAKINQGSSLFQGNQFSEAAGNMVTGSLKKMTAAELARYYELVRYLMIGGIIVAIIGGGMIIFCGKKSKKR